MTSRPQSGRGRRSEKDDPKIDSSKQDVKIGDRDLSTKSGRNGQGGRGTYSSGDDKSPARYGGSRWDRSRDQREKDTAYRGKDRGGDYIGPRRRDVERERPAPHRGGKMDSQRSGALEGRDRDGRSGSPDRGPRAEFVSADLRRQPDGSKAFVDDSRLSKLVRRLVREEDRDRKLAATKQLKDYLVAYENNKPVTKAADNLVITLQDLLQERTFKDVKDEAVLCLGIVGNVMGSEAHRYFEWLFAKLHAASSDETRIQLLTALLETLQQDGSRKKMEEFMPLIMDNCRTILENADLPELLVAVMEVIYHISKYYPHTFGTHFKDTVDILVGWHIDVTQKESLTTFTSEALVSFHQFWTGDITFSLTLLGQFLEDLEAYAEDLALGLSGQAPQEEDMPMPDECLIKIGALLRVYTTVLKSLGDYFSPEKTSSVTWEYIIENLERVVMCIDNVMKSSYNEKLLTAANVCVNHLVTNLGSQLASSCDSVLSFISGQCAQTHMSSNTYIKSLLTLTHKVVDLVNTKLPENFIGLVMGPDTLFYKLRFAQSADILRQLMAVYHTLMLLKNIPLLQEAYRYMLGDLEIAFNTLLEATESDFKCTLVTVNPFSDIVYSPNRAQTAIIFDICTLAEISNTKNNIIGMYALSPSIFELLTQHMLMLPSHSNVMEQYPAVHYAFLQALYSHCTRHGHFITSSHLITQNTSLEGTVLANLSSQAGSHFAIILALLSELLACSSTSHDARRLGLLWAGEIFESLATAQHIYRSKEFREMANAVVTLGFTNEIEITKGVCKCLKVYLRNNNRHCRIFLKRCQELCCIRLASSVAVVRDEYFGLLKLLPLSDTTGSETRMGEKTNGHQKKQSKSGTQSSEAYWLVRRSHMGKPSIGTFHTHNFRSIMAFILHGTPPGVIGSDTWLERIFHTSQRHDKDPRTDSSLQLSSIIDNSDALLWFWATWEAAQFCVMAKLRTPLGKPQETLPTIESALKQYASQIKAKEGEESSGIIGEKTKESRKENFKSQLRVRLLLQFMEHLEKLLYNAYEGCALAIAAPPKTVRAFFRTNRVTCEDWLTRVRLCIIITAIHNGEPALVVRQAYELLADMVDKNNTNVAEFEQVVMYLVQALCELRCPEALHGLYVWCKEEASKRMTWIKAAAELSSGRYEPAISDFKASLSHYIAPAESTSSEESKENKAATLAESPGEESPLDSPRDTEEEGVQRFSLLSKHHGNHASTSSSSTLDPMLANYMVNQVSECYLRLGNWQEVLAWQETLLQYRADHKSGALHRAFYTDIDINYVKALSQFEELDFASVKETLELIPGCSLSDVDTQQYVDPGVVWDRKAVVSTANRQFVRAITHWMTSDHLQSPIDTVALCLEQCQRLCEGVLRVESLSWPPQLSSPALIELYSSAVCLNQLTTDQTKSWLLPLNDEVKFDPSKHGVDMGLQVLRLLALQDHIQGVMPLEKPANFKGHISKLRLATANLARKQGNCKLCEKLLIEEMSDCVTTDPGVVDKPATLEDLMITLSSVQPDLQPAETVHRIRMEREVAKLLQCKGLGRDAVEWMTGSVLRHVGIASLKQTQHRELVKAGSAMNARSLVSLVQWCQAEQKFLGQMSSSLKLIGQGDEHVLPVVQSLKQLMELEQTAVGEKLGLSLEEGGQDVRIGDSPLLSDSESVVGRLLHLATIQSPAQAKAWFSLAGWCNKWGRKAVDSAVHGNIELTVDEKAQVLELLPRGTNNEEIDSVLSILSQIQTGMSSEEDISDQDLTLYDDGTDTTRRQLLTSCLSLQIASDECVDRLLEVWKGVVRRVYHFYQLSAKAYLTYLKINGQSCEEQTNMDGNITSTLRLLRLLVKHAWELREVLEEGLANTPTAPWKGIIPQLFSRLNHPEPYVRQSVSDLLCRVAQDAPHLIVYPAVVGCTTDKTGVKDTDRDILLNEYLQEKKEEEEEGEDGGEEVVEASPSSQDEEAAAGEDTNDALLRNCFSAIVDTLANSNPRMISEVQMLVSELRRITLLWDELWLGTLNQHHADVTRRLAQLENEVRKVMTNSSLNKEEKIAIIAEKHRTVLKPTVYTMERLYDITSQPAETKHEQWFQKTYGKLIEDALHKLKNPANPSHPLTSWQLFKQLHHGLQQRAQKRTSLLLNMEEISDKLANMKNTVIAMPGLTSDGQVVHIEGIYHTVQILPTKTKPKKLVLIGSDGKKYPYLFKGLEDLHLDERIMQFLAIVNNMFAKANKNDSRFYHARHYSVTPLGARSGLIQWVDGATPLFSLYKRWQQREAIAQQLKPGSSSQVSQTNPPAIPRPSEVYYSKLTPALKEKGITNLEEKNRKDWPLSVTKKALEDLLSETPCDLLSRELWCSSTSPTEWWHITHTYCRSTAVMSMIGYIIGLGDRHLDNVLVDLATGEVVHIDYNVCFEKGKSLRVPERVPFRMTQNIETALGVTGVEGIFRESCEYVIKTMRKGRETLLTLLEAFVYDPLVDWTTGNEGGYTGAFYGGGHNVSSTVEGRQSKREMERDITLSMFAIRVAEMKAAWFANREEMLASLPKLRECVQSHVSGQAEVRSTEEYLHRHQDQLAYIEEALGDPNHSVYTLGERYGEYAVVKASKLEVQQAIQEKLNEYEHWQKLYEYALQTILSPQLQKMCAEASHHHSSSLASFACVVDFLQGAGQAQLVSQCEEVSAELSGVILQRRSLLQSCLELLHTYATIIGHFPMAFLRDNKNEKWMEWLQELLCMFTSEKCKSIVASVQEQAEVCGGMAVPLASSVLATEGRLQAISSDTNSRLIKLIERRSLDNVETSLLTVHVQEAMTQVHLFMQENGMSGTMCMTSVVVTALSSLSRRYLIMEGAAAAAGDRLMDLTSREGDWFLDELCSMSGNVNHLLGLLNDPCVTLSAEVCHQVMQSMGATHSVYMALQDLNINFRAIIMPEALKALQSQEGSVLASLEALDTIVISAGRSMEELLAAMEIQLRNAIMGMEITDEEVITIVKKMRVRFGELLLAPSLVQNASQQMTMDLTPGQMLLMGFNGLFSRLDTDFSAMLDAISKVQIPDIWRKVDVIKEARSIQLTAFNESTIGLLSNLYFLKQLKAMQEFFHLASQMAGTLQGVTGGTCYDDDQLGKPIKLFIAEYVRKHMIGLPSQTLGQVLCLYVNALGVDVSAEIELRDIGAECKVSLEDLCKKAVDLCIKQDSFEHVHLTQASALLGSTDLAWRKSDLARRLDSNISMLKTSLQCHQLDLARYQWLQEDVITFSGRSLTQMVMPSRATLLADLAQSLQSLMTLETAVTSVQERHTQLEASVSQRLKWAAGANPSLSDVLLQYEEALQAKNSAVLNDSTLANEVFNLCNAALHFEALRTHGQEWMTASSEFLNLVLQCEECCQLVESSTITVEPVEETIMTSRPLQVGDKVTEEWLKNAVQEITEEISKLDNKMSTLSSQVDTTKDGVKSQVNAIRSILTTHHHLMSDIRTILKSMARQEEHDFGPEVVDGGVRQYVNTYKTFSENFTAVLKLVMSEELTAGVIHDIDKMLAKLTEQIATIYDDLVNYAPPLTTQAKEEGSTAKLDFASAAANKAPMSASEVSYPNISPKKLPLARSELRASAQAGLFTPPTGSKAGTPTIRKAEKITRDPKTGKAIQERNSYALGVWRRVKLKLDGRDPDPNRRLSVAEQVDYVIQEATSLDNLAVLYEGWTPWV